MLVVLAEFLERLRKVDDCNQLQDQRLFPCLMLALELVLSPLVREVAQIAYVPQSWLEENQLLQLESEHHQGEVG
jgi:regulator of replication initiation timing